MELNDNQIEIYDEEGNKYLMEILFTFEDQNNNSYAFIYDKSSPDCSLSIIFLQSITTAASRVKFALGEAVVLLVPVKYPAL